MPSNVVACHDGHQMHDGMKNCSCNYLSCAEYIEEKSARDNRNNQLNSHAQRAFENEFFLRKFEVHSACQEVGLR